MRESTYPRYLPGKQLSRRAFLQVGSAGALCLGLPDVLRAESTLAASPLPIERPRAKNLILVWLGGGPATIDMWDPKPEAPAEIRGDFGTISTKLPGVLMSEHMPRVAEVLDRAVLIRSLHHNIPDHTPGTQYVMTGNKPSAALEYPSLGSLAARLLPATLGMPAYFTVGEVISAGAGFLGSEHDPFRVSAPASPSQPVDLNGIVLPEGMDRSVLERRRNLRDLFGRQFVGSHRDVDIVPTLSKFQQQADAILASNRVGAAFDLAVEPESVRELYGASPVGRQALTARRLVEAGARFVTIGTNEWDTHSGNFGALRRSLPPLDQALQALIIDLDRRGMLDETLVVCGGEFGRTPEVNRGAGRDHWSRSMSFLLSGGGLRRGYVHGATDEKGFDPTEGHCSPDDLAATLLLLLGIPPQHRVFTNAGRPIELFKQGRPIAEVIA